jgi:hypothetical protein
MNAGLLSPLVVYLILLAVGFLWILIDKEMVYIFDVFGRGFQYMWFHSGQRWKCTIAYGTRLLALLLLIIAELYLANQMAFSTPERASNVWPIIRFATLGAIPLSFIPWISMALLTNSTQT